MKKLARAVAAVRQSEYMMNSPVAYFADLLDMYVQGTLSPAELARDSKDRTQAEQFVFFHMPSEQIRENQRVFSNEFVFADTLYRIMQTGRQTEKTKFTQMLLDCVEQYTAGYTDRIKPAE